MQALRINESGIAEVQNVPEPESGVGENILKVLYCALCAADAKIVASGHRALRLPRIPGHEICAVDESNGRKYVVWPGKACGKCKFCLSGRENLCPEMQITGFHRDGGFAEYISVREESLIPLENSISPELACLAEPAACAINGIEKSGLKPGDDLLIFGAGPLGLLLALKARDSARGFIREINPERIASCKKFCEGAGFEINQDLPDKKFDIAVNAASDVETVVTGLNLLKPGGRMVFFSGIASGEQISSGLLNEIHYRELSVSGAYGCTRKQMSEGLRLIAESEKQIKLLKHVIVELDAVPELLLNWKNNKIFKYIAKIG